MENQAEEGKDLLQATNLQFDDRFMRELYIAGRWAKGVAIFIIVIAIVCVASLTILYFTQDSDYNLLDEISFPYILGFLAGFACILLIPIITLWRFSNGTHPQPGALEKGIRSLKNYFLFAGIITLLGAFFKIVELFT